VDHLQQLRQQRLLPWVQEQVWLLEMQQLLLLR
jgi:hypothetical protein